MLIKKIIGLTLLMIFSVGSLALGGETPARDRDSRERMEAAGNPTPAQFRRRRQRRWIRRHRRLRVRMRHRHRRM